MGQILHGSATTTEAVRRAIQHGQKSLRALAARYGINQKTVANMEDVLEVYRRPHDPQRPFVCLDETSKQMNIETRAPIPDKQTLTSEAAAWQENRDKHYAKADWQFTTADARVKLKRLYPRFQ